MPKVEEIDLRGALVAAKARLPGLIDTRDQRAAEVALLETQFAAATAAAATEAELALIEERSANPKVLAAVGLQTILQTLRPTPAITAARPIRLIP